MRPLSSVVILALIASVAMADPRSKKRADKLFEDGRKYLTNGEYSLACTAFEQSQKADVAIGTQLNIALCYEKWGRLAAAHEAYVEAERQARQSNDKRSAVARMKSAELEPKVAHLRVTPPDGIDRYAIYLLDAAEIEVGKLTAELVLDPGSHVIEVRVAGAPPSKNEITLEPGQHAKLALAAPVVENIVPVADKAAGESPTPVTRTTTTTHSKPALYGGIGLVVAGAATIGVASFVALDARSAYNVAKQGCPDAMCATQADFEATRDARNRAHSTTWVFAGGAAVAVIGTILIATSKRTTTSESISLTPTLSDHAAGIAIRGAL